MSDLLWIFEPDTKTVHKYSIPTQEAKSARVQGAQEDFAMNAAWVVLPNGLVLVTGGVLDFEETNLVLIFSPESNTV
jgi:hypothetical protein